MVSKKESYVIKKKTYYINTLKTVDYKKYNKKHIKMKDLFNLLIKH